LAAWRGIVRCRTRRAVSTLRLLFSFLESS
jgi:hypothetical protein